MTASTSTVSSMHSPIVLPIGTIESWSPIQTASTSQNRNASRRGMLLVLPAPFCRQGSKFFFELQACNGIEQWADHFGSVVVVAPLLPDARVEQEKNVAWRDTATLAQPERFELIPVPWAYSIKLFATHYAATRKLLAGLIDRCQYLQFPLGGLFGDWGSVAALEAYQQHRAYAIHTDLVEDQVIRQLAQGKPWRTRIKEGMLATLAKNYYGQIIQRSSLALLHGEDCYAAYSGLCAKSFLVHDTHTKPEDTITAVDLARKLKDAAGLDSAITPTLRICYTGRMVAMKAPLDWIRAIGKARDLGAKVQATWLGDGDLRQDMERLITELGLEDCIELLGYEDDRHKVLQALRDAHLLLFTHVTPESPRCLIEAFVSGTAIVGYESRYAESLTQDGGGALVPIHRWHQLGEVLRDLWRDRHRLVQLIEQAAAKRSRFNDQAVFQERSELIKQHLS
jgi:glycosyltransferase involved in cell wall biosynthesis